MSRKSDGSAGEVNTQRELSLSPPPSESKQELGTWWFALWELLVITPEVPTSRKIQQLNFGLPQFFKCLPVAETQQLEFLDSWCVKLATR